MDFIDKHLEILVVLFLVGAVIFLALAKLAVELMLSWLRDRLSGRHWMDAPLHHNVYRSEQPTNQKSCCYVPPIVKKKASLSDWLKEHNDKKMWWKEYLRHEGSGKRSAEEEQQAVEIYQNALQRLNAEAEVKKQEMIEKWILEGLSNQQALKRWQDMEEQIHYESRLEYAMQKD